MFIFGSQGKVIDLGEVEQKHCPVCERERSFHLYLRYVLNHFWFIFGYISGKQYVTTCEICGRGEPANAQEVEARFPKSPIPYMHQKGCLVGIIGFIVFVLIAIGIGAIFGK